MRFRLPDDWFIDTFLLTEEMVAQDRLVIQVQAESRGVPPAQAIWDLLDVIDTKASALLTHISLMAAVVGLILSGVSETTAERVIVALELSGYLLLALLCLRCFYMVNDIAKEADGGAYLEYAEREWSRRKAVYRFCLAGTKLVTVLLILSMFAHILL